MEMWTDSSGTWQDIPARGCYVQCLRSDCFWEKTKWTRGTCGHIWTFVQTSQQTWTMKKRNRVQKCGILFVVCSTTLVPLLLSLSNGSRAALGAKRNSAGTWVSHMLQTWNLYDGGPIKFWHVMQKPLGFVGGGTKWSKMIVIAECKFSLVHKVDLDLTRKKTSVKSVVDPKGRCFQMNSAFAVAVKLLAAH